MHLSASCDGGGRVQTLPDADALLRGEHAPRDDDERLALAAICADRGLNAASAKLWSDCIASQPALLADHGYYAAVLAALAGCGKGSDAQSLGAVERAELRKQAAEWLTGQLEPYERMISTMSEEDLRQVRFKLRVWRTSPAFAGIRDEAAVAILPPDEQELFRDLWTRVDRIFNRRP